MRLQNNRSYLIYIVTAGIFRLLLCKRSYTFYICILLAFSVTAQEKTVRDTNSLNNPEFVKFMELVNSSGDFQKIDTLELLREKCNQYKLVWAYYNNTGQGKLEKSTVEQSFCIIIDAVNDLNSVLQKNESVYGMWNYDVSASERYIIANGSCAIGSELSSVFYYEKKDMPILRKERINDTIIHDGYSGISIYDFIENYKDSVLKDSTILSIRKQGINCFSDHGGSFDWYYCTMCFDENKILLKYYFLRDIPECFSGRTHHYGRSIDQGQINDDKYYLNGKLIKWIKANTLENFVDGKSHVRIHIYEVE
jgi:hypothetical protein